jgi:hypothetical protein
MSDIDYVQLQQRFGGRSIARCDGEVVASAETYDTLSDRLDSMSVPWETLVIEYIEPVSSVCLLNSLYNKSSLRSGSSVIP